MMLRIRNFKLLSFLAICIIALQVSAQEISKDLSDFKELKTFNGVQVIVIPSNENKIEITGHSSEKVKFEIVEDRLEIRLSLDNIWSEDNTLISVFGKSIEIIDANEGSTVRTKEALRSESPILRAQEGASIFAEVLGKELRSKAISGGTITITGKVVSQEVEVNTGGQFYGKDLKTKNTTISVSTAGRGEVYVTDYCKATAKLGGIVEILGNPGKLDHKTSLGGKIL